MVFLAFLPTTGAAPAQLMSRTWIWGEGGCGGWGEVTQVTATTSHGSAIKHAVS